MSNKSNQKVTTIKTDANSAILATEVSTEGSTEKHQGTKVYLLGNAAFSINDSPVNLKSVQVVLLIAYITESKTSIPRKDLAQLFWPGRELKDALKLLSTLLSRVNKLLPNYLVSYTNATGINHVALSEKQDTVVRTTYIDSVKFKKLIANNDYDSLMQANSLYRGGFLAGIEVKGESQKLELWLEHTREVYQDCYTDVQHKIIDFANEDKNYEKALTHLQVLLTLDPFDEELHRLALKLYYQLNNKLGLVNHYNYLVKSIAEEFGAEVDEALSDYYHSLIKKLEISNSRAVSYKLPEFYDNETFIGRGKELALLKNLVAEKRFISIVGMTGIGKSSLLLQLLYQLQTEEAFPEGILLIPQESSSDFNLLEYLIDQFGLSKSDSNRLDLVDFLKTKEILLAFDGATVLQDEYQLLEDLMSKTSSLKIITTSLKPLGLSYEAVSYLQGFDIPSKTMSYDGAFSTEAGQFFLQCVKRVKKPVPESNEDLRCWENFYNLCYLSQGSPLIIAIAASWLDILSLEEINSDLLGLTHLYNDTTPRHKSVKAIFETVWQFQQSMPVLDKNQVSNNHYPYKLGSNASITLTEADMKAFEDYTSAHPLFQQLCNEKTK